MSAQHKAWIPSDEEYNALTWEELSGEKEELSAVLDGFRIIGAETVDYPLPDEIDIYLQNDAGQLLALRAGMDPYELHPKFYISVSHINAQTNEAPAPTAQ